MQGLSVVILSNTNSEKIHRMTLECIDSLMRSEAFSAISPLEIILVESNQDYLAQGFAYPEHVITILPDIPFNFHAYLNIGILRSTMSFVALCNNDLLFHQGWFSAIRKVKEQHPSIRSFCPVQPGEAHGAGTFETGYLVRQQIKGWCLVADRELFNRIGLLDEQFNFYYADDDYAMTLRKYHEPHALVYGSLVTHLGGENTGSSREAGDESFLNVTGKYTDLPAYLYTDGYRWILKNEKLLEGHLKFHRKWGTVKSIAIKMKCYHLLSKVGLGSLVLW